MKNSNGQQECGATNIRRRGRLVALNGVMCLLALFLGIGLPGCDDTDSAIEQSKDTAQAIVHSAAYVISECLKPMGDAAQRIEFIRSFIAPLRFYPDSTGYFYVYDSACVNIAHATQANLVGQNLYDYTDSRGTFVIRELLAAAQAGGGFVEYYWIKPGEEGEKLKIGYVEMIPGTDYFIGTGVYLE